MGLSDCECGGFIALGPTASNRCDKCGKGVFSPLSSESAERRAEYWKAEHIAANVRIAELETALAEANEVIESAGRGMC